MELSQLEQARGQQKKQTGFLSTPLYNGSLAPIIISAEWLLFILQGEVKRCPWESANFAHRYGHWETRPLTIAFLLW